jgi:hypothetical protein
MIKLILKNLYSFVLESENEKQEKLIGKCVNGHFYKLNYGFCKYCNSKTKTKEVFIQPVVESKVKSKKDERKRKRNVVDGRSSCCRYSNLTQMAIC